MKKIIGSWIFLEVVLILQLMGPLNDVLKAIGANVRIGPRFVGSAFVGSAVYMTEEDRSKLSFKPDQDMTLREANSKLAEIMNGLIQATRESA